MKSLGCNCLVICCFFGGILGAWGNLATFGAWNAARLREQNIIICGSFGVPYLFIGFYVGAFLTGMLLVGATVVGAYYDENARTARRLRAEKTRAWLLDR